MRVQLPCGTACASEYGEPPVMGAERPSHVSSQETSLLNVSSVTLTAEVSAGSTGGGGGEGGGEGGVGEDGGARGGGSGCGSCGGCVPT